MDSAFVRLLAVAVLAFLPGLCFLALFRLVDHVAHDELVARVERGEFETESPPSGATPTIDPASAVAAARDRETAVCPSCGAENRAGVDYCRHCLSELR
ncbi:DUF7577 domain-containing protein [Halosimplex pelagicum]|uniref:Zinc ribbon domain-containing protein n=1 Tax=Halosimplex pelagicum TaxID=869886 RepID=A0A7D5TDG7_9EURY|nr:zinc-ribbon domain-containing protein [Halosimplex pelagicum]QLH83913.1 zinc ribbon domain-containing protein [Halosimplex pelagicum]